jgi:hypothetical protein
LDKAIKDGLPAKKHKVIRNDKNENVSLDGDGEPNSSQDFPHGHEWDWSKNPPRQKDKNY